MKKLIIILVVLLYGIRANAQLNNGNLVAHWDFNSVPGSVNVTDNIQGWVGTPLIPANAYAIPGFNSVANTAIELLSTRLQVPYDPIMDNMTSWTIIAKVAVWDIGGGYNVPNNIVERGSSGGGNYMSLYASSLPYNSTLPPGAPLTNYAVFAGAAPQAQPFGDDKWYLGSFGTTQPILQLLGYQWHCVTASYNDQANEFLLFVDGVCYVREHWSSANSPSPDDLFIGNDHGVIALDDLLIYSEAVQFGTDVAAYCTTCDRTLIGHWDFENTIDGTINGNIVTSTSTGPISYMSGSQPGNTAVRIQSGSYIDVPYDPALDLTSWTITAVVAVEGFYSGRCQSNAIVWRSSQFSDEFYGLYYWDNPHTQDCNIHDPSQEVFGGIAAGPNGFAGGQWDTDFTGNINPNPLIQTNQWYCVAATYDGVKEEFNLWVDGIHTVSHHHPNIYNYTNQNIMRIGAGDLLGSYPYFMDGMIDDIKIYAGVTCDDVLQNCGMGTPKNSDPGNSTGINNTKSQKLDIYPNPANQSVTINAPADLGIAAYSIIDVTGRIILNGSFKGSITLSVSNIPEGIYIVKVQQNETMHEEKLVISH